MKKIYFFLTMLVTLCLAGTMQAQSTLTVHDGEATSQYIPFDGYNADHAQHNQMIYPASDLSAMNGMEITQMVFYFNGSYGTSYSSPWHLDRLLGRDYCLNTNRTRRQYNLEPSISRNHDLGPHCPHLNHHFRQWLCLQRWQLAY